MANNRYVNTAVWKDNWFVNLRLPEQHLWLYLLTNPQTNIAGVYEISLREMAFDTTIDQEEIKRIFRDRFQPDGKAYYEVGWVVLKNFIKHQSLNPTVVKGIVAKFNAAPEWLRKQLLDTNSKLYLDLKAIQSLSGIAYDSLCIDPDNFNLTLTKLNLTKLNAQPGDKPVDKSSLYRRRQMP